MTSDEPLPDRCGAKCSDGGYCTQYPVAGSNRCRMHGGHSPGAPTGKENGNYKHGAFSKHFRSDLTEHEENALQEVVDGLDDPNNADAIVREVAAEALMKAKRSADPRMLSEARQWLAEFNIGELDSSEKIDMDGTQSVELDSDTAAAIRNATNPDS